MTQEQVRAATGVSRADVSRIENGRYTAPNRDMAGRLCVALGVSDALREQALDHFFPPAPPKDTAPERYPANPTGLGEWLRALRPSDMSQGQLAAATGVNQAKVSGIEHGSYTRPSRDVVESLCVGLGVSDELREQALARFFPPAPLKDTAPESYSANPAGLGEWLEALRHNIDMSQQRLAGAARVSSSYVSEIENGLHTPSRDVAGRLCVGLGVSDALREQALAHFFPPASPKDTAPGSYPANPAGLGRWLLALRRKADMTQRKLAAAAGVNRSYVSGIEPGRKMPSRDMVGRLCVGLGVSDELREQGLARFFPPADTAPASYPANPAGLGKWLKALRGKRTQQQLADAAGVSMQSVSRIENGGRPRLRTLRRLCDGLEVYGPRRIEVVRRFHCGHYPGGADPDEEQDFWDLVDTAVGSAEEREQRNRIYEGDGAVGGRRAGYGWIAEYAARRWARSAADRDDLHQVAREAVLAAIVNHAPTAPFIAHAFAVSRGAIRGAYFERRYPGLDHRTRRIVAAVATHLRGVEPAAPSPTPAHTAAALGLTVADVTEALRILGQHSVSLDQPVAGRSGEQMPRQIADPAALAAFADRDFVDSVRADLAGLDDAETATRLVVLHLGYGIPLNQQPERGRGIAAGAAQQLGLSAAQAAEIISTAVPLLRAARTPVDGSEGQGDQRRSGVADAWPGQDPAPGPANPDQGADSLDVHIPRQRGEHQEADISVTTPDAALVAQLRTAAVETAQRAVDQRLGVDSTDDRAGGSEVDATAAWRAAHPGDDVTWVLRSVGGASVSVDVQVNGRTVAGVVVDAAHHVTNADPPIGQPSSASDDAGSVNGAGSQGDPLTTSAADGESTLEVRGTPADADLPPAPGEGPQFPHLVWAIMEQAGSNSLLFAPPYYRALENVEERLSQVVARHRSDRGETTERRGSPDELSVADAENSGGTGSDDTAADVGRQMTSELAESGPQSRENAASQRSEVGCVPEVKRFSEAMGYSGGDWNALGPKIFDDLDGHHTATVPYALRAQWRGGEQRFSSYREAAAHALATGGVVHVFSQWDSYPKVDGQLPPPAGARLDGHGRSLFVRDGQEWVHEWNRNEAQIPRGAIRVGEDTYEYPFADRLFGDAPARGPLGAVALVPSDEGGLVAETAFDPDAARDLATEPKAGQDYPITRMGAGEPLAEIFASERWPRDTGITDEQAAAADEAWRRFPDGRRAAERDLGTADLDEVRLQAITVDRWHAGLDQWLGAERAQQARIGLRLRDAELLARLPVRTEEKDQAARLLLRRTATAPSASALDRQIAEQLVRMVDEADRRVDRLPGMGWVYVAALDLTPISNATVPGRPEWRQLNPRWIEIAIENPDSASQIALHVVAPGTRLAELGDEVMFGVEHARNARRILPGEPTPVVVRFRVDAPRARDNSVLQELDGRRLLADLAAGQAVREVRAVESGETAPVIKNLVVSGDAAAMVGYALQGGPRTGIQRITVLGDPADMGPVEHASESEFPRTSWVRKAARNLQQGKRVRPIRVSEPSVCLVPTTRSHWLRSPLVSTTPTAPIVLRWRSRSPGGTRWMLTSAPT